MPLAAAATLPPLPLANEKPHRSRARTVSSKAAARRTAHSAGVPLALLLPRAEDGMAVLLTLPLEREEYRPGGQAMEAAATVLRMAERGEESCPGGRRRGRVLTGGRSGLGLRSEAEATSSVALKRYCLSTAARGPTLELGVGVGVGVDVILRVGAVEKEFEAEVVEEVEALPEGVEEITASDVPRKVASVEGESRALEVPAALSAATGEGVGGVVESAETVRVRGSDGAARVEGVTLSLALLPPLPPGSPEALKERESVGEGEGERLKEVLLLSESVAEGLLLEDCVTEALRVAQGLPDCRGDAVPERDAETELLLRGDSDTERDANTEVLEERVALGLGDAGTDALAAGVSVPPAAPPSSVGLGCDEALGCARVGVPKVLGERVAAPGPDGVAAESSVTDAGAETTAVRLCEALGVPVLEAPAPVADANCSAGVEEGMRGVALREGKGVAVTVATTGGEGEGGLEGVMLTLPEAVPSPVGVEGGVGVALARAVWEAGREALASGDSVEKRDAEGLLPMLAVSSGEGVAVAAAAVAD